VLSSACHCLKKDLWKWNSGCPQNDLEITWCQNRVSEWTACLVSAWLLRHWRPQMLWRAQDADEKPKFNCIRLYKYLPVCQVALAWLSFKDLRPLNENTYRVYTG
jgi:hypothetical protein